jgi:hypothetical protein
MSTSVPPTSVPCALKTACALPASSATALRVSAISVVSGTPDLRMQGNEAISVFSIKPAHIVKISPPDFGSSAYYRVGDSVVPQFMARHEQFTSRSSYSEPLAQILFFGGLGLVIDSFSPDRATSIPRARRPSAIVPILG